MKMLHLFYFHSLHTYGRGGSGCFVASISRVVVVGFVYVCVFCCTRSSICVHTCVCAYYVYVFMCLCVVDTSICVLLCVRRCCVCLLSCTHMNMCFYVYVHVYVAYVFCMCTERVCV
eukprot:GHVS01062740.1.p1 GENE.GHVS01062740.1~~GHVS01062740.1.p1  ORF type:complete len:117 (+),score=7.07 GHVS01062740.1:247-597(+)